VGFGASFPNVPFSIAASIILFPLMIDVVQITMFLLAAWVGCLVSDRANLNKKNPRGPLHTFFLLRNEAKRRNLGEADATDKYDEHRLLVPAPRK
jgi:hypothetical protein